MLDKVIAKHKPVQEAVDPDFDADEYMRNDNVSTANEEAVLASMGFQAVENIAYDPAEVDSSDLPRWVLMTVSGVHVGVELLELTHVRSKWAIVGTVLKPGAHTFDLTPRLIWISNRDGDFKSAIDFTIACGEQRMNEAIEDPDFDADEYMAIDSSSGLEFKDYLKRKGFQHLHGNSYSKEYRNLNVRVRIFVSTPMDVDGERDGSIFAEAKEATDYYQDHSSVFWKTWHLANPPEDAVNEVCELASNPNGTLGWLRDAYKQYRERLGESIVEADEPDLDADDYMSTPDPVSAEQQTLEKMGFTEYSPPMLDKARGDKQWQRQRGETCIYAYYDATRGNWSITGTVFGRRRQEWYPLRGGGVEYTPGIARDFAGVVERMQARCGAAVMSLARF
jgi:hypothetical protein